MDTIERDRLTSKVTLEVQIRSIEDIWLLKFSKSVEQTAELSCKTL